MCFKFRLVRVSAVQWLDVFFGVNRQEVKCDTDTGETIDCRFSAYEKKQQQPELFDIRAVLTSYCNRLTV